MFTKLMAATALNIGQHDLGRIARRSACGSARVIGDSFKEVVKAYNAGHEHKVDSRSALCRARAENMHCDRPAAGPDALFARPDLHAAFARRRQLEDLTDGEGAAYFNSLSPRM